MISEVIFPSFLGDIWDGSYFWFSIGIGSCWTARRWPFKITWCHTCQQHSEEGQTCLGGHSPYSQGNSTIKSTLTFFTCHCRHTAPYPWPCWSPGLGWWFRCSCSPSCHAGTSPGKQTTWWIGNILIMLIWLINNYTKSTHTWHWEWPCDIQVSCLHT